MLRAETLATNTLSEATIIQMYTLMDTFYNNTSQSVFLADLMDKDKAIILRTPEGDICGFSTLKLLDFTVDGVTVGGVFSGDTIIHKDHWGSTQLFRSFLRETIPLAADYEHFYWMLISKGHKTYQLLPLFFKTFYPSLNADTPPFERRVAHSYASLLFGEDYNHASGLIEYKVQKDYLKSGVADEDTIRSGNKHAKYFLTQNPTYASGTELVCLASLKRENLRPSALRMLEQS